MKWGLDFLQAGFCFKKNSWMFAVLFFKTKKLAHKSYNKLNVRFELYAKLLTIQNLP
jgi:hypothetical protein